MRHQERKVIRVPMMYRPTGERIWWTVQRYPSIGWYFTDQDGYERFGGATWLELLERFNLTASNHNMDHNLS